MQGKVAKNKFNTSFSLPQNIKERYRRAAHEIHSLPGAVGGAELQLARLTRRPRPRGQRDPDGSAGRERAGPPPSQSSCFQQMPSLGFAGRCQEKPPRSHLYFGAANSASLVPVPGALRAIGCYRRGTSTSGRGPCRAEPAPPANPKCKLPAPGHQADPEQHGAWSLTARSVLLQSSFKSPLPSQGTHKAKEDG